MSAKIETKLKKLWEKHGKPTTHGPTTDVLGLDRPTVDTERLYKYIGYTYLGSGIWTKHTECDENWNNYFTAAYELLSDAGEI